MSDHNNPALYKEIMAIHNRIEKVKLELAEKMPNGKVPEATQELHEVIRSTEEATDAILDAAEKIRTASQSLDKGLDAKKAIDAEIVKIFEACNFQDITGQRIKKVISVLEYIENSIDHIITTFDVKQTHPDSKKKKSIEEMSDKDLMNGPQFNADAPNQDDIDKLFDSV